MISLSGIARVLLACGAFAAVLSLTAPAFGQAARKKVLYLTKSSGFEHGAVKRSGDRLSLSEAVLTELGAKNGFDIVCTKDGSLLADPATYTTYDVIMLYTSGDITRDSKDGGKGAGAEGLAMFLRAVENGKGVVGIHAATDTCASRNKSARVRPEKPGPDISPFVCMMGADFAGHGAQQKAVNRMVSPTFPGLEGLKDFEMVEEWYTFMNLAPDMHVILVQDTTSMKGPKGDGNLEKMYQRPPYPATWARMHGRGRVFYTSLGHRDDVVKSPVFAQVVLAGLNWAAGNTHFDPKPNLKQVCPQD